ncbi:ATP-binding protein [Alkalihalobacillus deserti]|uniref:ATP-binding protein n=1 Tax=Alkalihalobacillus deserti TaxID=2879466 RepID=UPI001D149703|nr:ATP-binding protein [Alkalihalobacillus deserti]
MIELLLINFLFLLFPVLIYFIYFENNLHIYSKKVVILLSSITMVLCMTFPIRLEPGFIFDLRYLPFIIASLFAGYTVAFPLYIVLNLYRFIIGGDGLLPSLLFSTFVFILVPLWSKKFNQVSSQNRILMVGIISFLTMALYLSILSAFFQTLNKEFWFFVINVLTIHVAGIMIIMILIEKILFNVKSREKIIDSDRLSVIGELSASISHEIRNPLTVTNGFLQLLNKSKNISQDEKRYVNLSLQELKRAERIVSDFLSLAKPQAKNMVSSTLKDEFEYVNNIMIAYANIHHVDLQFTFKNNLITRYDKNQIQQCLINLYKNAIESMKEKGGTLSIDVSGEKKKIIIKIKDTGIGMSIEEVLRLGRPYYSTKEGGTGLGMIMIYSTINKLGGKIKVDSEKEIGTTFLINIPVNKS